MSQFKNRKTMPQLTNSGEPYTQEQLDLGINKMQKLSFLRFLKKGPVKYSLIDRTMFFIVSSLLNHNYISLNNGVLSFEKDLV